MMIAAILLLQALPPIAAPASKQKVVCKSIGTTGSRLGGKRVCATKQQWDERAYDDKQAIDRMAANTVEKVGTD